MTSKPSVASPSSNPPKSPLLDAISWKNIGLAATFLALAAVMSPVSQYNLSPIYGSIPAAAYHQRGVWLVSLMAFVAKAPLKSVFRFDARRWLPVIGFYIPPIQALLFEFSADLGPTWGPLLTESFTYYPLLYFACLAAGYAFDEIDLSPYGQTIADGMPALISYAVIAVVQKIANQYLPYLMGSTDFFTRSGLELLMASIYAMLSSSQLLLLAVPAMLHTMFVNPHYPSTNGTKRLNNTLSAFNYTILERRDSVTGYVSVLESHKDMFRVMRCDHSLLGGEWLMTPQRKMQGQTGREAVYSVFTMLEAVRLVDSTSHIPDSEKSALFVGLGIGTSPTAFIHHGINTTIVELDPVVHDFALKYFALPPNHTAIIQDAVPFVESVALSQPGSYDYIIHDVFTGGAEPTPLFTLEFLRGLGTLLKDDGVVAINYAGDITMSPPRLILNTIHAVFPTCRIYRDSPPEEGATTFINMVVFCTKRKDKPINFRKAVKEDWLGSLARREFVPPPESLEMRLEDVQGTGGGKEGKEVLKRGEEWKVEKYHLESAKRHWRIMRTVLPNEVWENW